MRGDDQKIVLSYHVNRGQLRCAAAAVAAERYRRARGHWPERLDDLVPAYLARVPVDPFEGRPLPYRRLPDGVVVGPVGDDEALQPHGSENTPKDIGFRLWDVAHRSRRK